MWVLRQWFRKRRHGNTILFLAAVFVIIRASVSFQPTITLNVSKLWGDPGQRLSLENREWAQQVHQKINTDVSNNTTGHVKVPVAPNNTSGMDTAGHVTVHVARDNTNKETSKLVSDHFCQQHFHHVNSLPDSETPTNWSDWRFTENHYCPTVTLKENTTTWNKVLLSCKTGQLTLSLVMTSSSSDVMAVPHDDACLVSYLQSCCRDRYIVPNVAHYVWIGSKVLGFFQFISFLSVMRFMKPCLFLFHGSLPRGIYWDYFRSLAPNVVLVNRTTVEYVYGQKLKYIEHSADVMRIDAVQTFGGYYLDWDKMLLKTVDDLRKYPCTMGQAIPNYLTIGFIMGERNSTFLRLWHEGYMDYKEDWGHNSLHVPYTIYKKYPETLHVAGYKFVRPNFTKLKSIFTFNYDWSNNYGMHLYIRFYKKFIDLNVIRGLNSTMGAVCRHVLFGDKDLCQPL